MSNTKQREDGVEVGVVAYISKTKRSSTPTTPLCKIDNVLIQKLNFDSKIKIFVIYLSNDVLL